MKITKMKNTLAVLFAILLLMMGTQMAFASPILQDDFNSENSGVGMLITSILQTGLSALALWILSETDFLIFTPAMVFTSIWMVAQGKPVFSLLIRFLHLAHI